MSLGRIEDYTKGLPIVELYTAVQSEGSRQGYPTVVIRTTGCTHRCWFGEGGWCDSWYTSIHPEKGKYCFQDIIDMYDKHPYIKEMMLTGGSPSMHGKLVNELTNFAQERDIFITMENEGSHFLETDWPIGLLSISPKFSNSIPKLGVLTPQGREVDQRMIDKHNSLRLNIKAIAQSIKYHKDFHIKPVLDKNLSIYDEVWEFLNDLADELYNIRVWGEDDDGESLYTREEIFQDLFDQTWMMPAGDTREALFETYPVVMNFCRDKGFKFTGRAHIMAFNDQREV